MKRCFSRTFLCSLLVAVGLFPGGAVAADMSDDELDRAMVALVTPRIKTFERDVYVYHWTNQWAAGFNPENHVNDTAKPEGAKPYFLERLRQKETRSGSNGNSGYGFYAAVDPSATRSYGNNHSYISKDGVYMTTPAVYEIVLKKGSGYFDQREGISNVIPDHIRQEMIKRGCHVWDLNSLFAQGGQTESCHKLVKKLIDKFGIVGQAYSYNGTSYSQCAWSNYSRGTAFVLFNPELIDGDWTVLSPSAPKNASDPLAEQRNRSFHSLEDYRAGEADPQLRAWMREHLYECGTYAEDYRESMRENALSMITANQIISRQDILNGFGDLTKTLKERLSAYRAVDGDKASATVPTETLKTGRLSDSLDQFWNCSSPRAQQAQQACPACAERDATNGSGKLQSLFDSCRIDMKTEQLAFAQEPLRSLLDRIDATLEQIPPTNKRYGERLCSDLAELLSHLPSDLGRRVASAVFKTAVENAKSKGVSVAEWYSKLVKALGPYIDKPRPIEELNKTESFIRGLVATMAAKDNQKAWAFKAPYAIVTKGEVLGEQVPDLRPQFKRVREEIACLDAVESWKKANPKEFSEKALSDWIAKEDQCAFLR